MLDFLFDLFVVRVGVQHDHTKSQDVGSVLVLKQRWVGRVVPFRKTLHHAINHLCFPGQHETI